MSLSSKHNYINKNIKYIKNAIITEYDMKNGGISILYHKGFLTKDEYDYLMNNLNKLERNIEIGKWLKNNKEVSIGLMEGFKEARELFFNENDINDSDVLSIKKDAIFLIDKQVKVKQLNEDYLFREKNQYSSYLNLLNKEFYFSLMDNILDVKGFSEDVVNIQKNYLFKFIQECLELSADSKNEKLFIKLLEFKNNYITKKLPFEYYYDINFGGYLFKYDYYTIILDSINNELLNNEYFNINTNLNVIIELISNLLA
jgi:hypothetical protein